MEEQDEQQRRINPSQWTIAAFVVVYFVAALFYLNLRRHNLMHSAALFIGLPAVLSLLLALSPRAKSATGAILKGITLALLIVAPLLGEGYLCILIASPLFYMMGIGIGKAVDWSRDRKGTTLSAISLLLLPFCLEGAVPRFVFHRGQTVEADEVVNASPAVVEEALSKRLNVSAPLSHVLRVGFPRPLWTIGEGLNVGDMRRIHFAGAEGDPPGDLVMRVAERRNGYARFDAVSDDSKLTQWIAWRNSEVEWSAVDARHTRVVWRIHFDRELDPAWYFAPIERVVVRSAAEYLIEANAIPQGGR